MTNKVYEYLKNAILSKLRNVVQTTKSMKFFQSLVFVRHRCVIIVTKCSICHHYNDYVMGKYGNKIAENISKSLISCYCIVNMIKKIQHYVKGRLTNP